MKSTKQQILQLAEQLIRRRGYHAFSYKDIAVELGVKNAAIHYHFPSKEQLGAAVIEENRINFRQAVQRWKQQPLREQVAYFMQIYTQSQHRGLVCIMGALGPTFDTLPPKMQGQLRLMGEELLDWLTATLKEGKETGAFEFPERTEEKARIIVNALLASLVTGRVMQQDFTTSVYEGLLKSF